MQTIVAFLALFGMAAASGSFSYYGRYQGKCGNDGIYFRDSASFVLCSNGNAYVQPCAPGSKNGAYGSYSYGKSYGYADFCGVNLVDYGYGAKSRGYGYGSPAYGYDRPAYGYGPGPAFGYGYDAPAYGYGPGPYNGGYATYEKRESYGARPSYGPSYGKGYERVEVRKTRYSAPARKPW